MTSSPSLPFELVEEILYKIHIKSLVRFKSICKEWNGLLNDKRFIYKHLDLSKERFILFEPRKIQLFSPETKSLVRLPIPDEFHSRIYFKTIHCDGLLLCSSYRLISNTSINLAVRNPVLRRVKWIKPSNSSKSFDAYGFGYDNVSRENYKILRMNKGKLSEVEIYEFKSKLWRSVGATLECSAPCESVSMKGNMYWIAEKERVNSEIEIFI